jgi:tetratricopeptide (TPR) repeat protein
LISNKLFLQKAETLFKQGKFAACKDLIHQILLIDKNNYRANELLGRVLIDSNNFEESIKYLSFAANHSECDVETLYYIANYYFDKNDYKNANLYFIRAINKNIPLYELYFLYALNNVQLTYFDEAEVYFLKALSIKKSCYECFFNLGKVAEHKANLSLAISYYDKAIHHNKFSYDAFINKALLLFDHYLLSEALFTIKQCFDYLPPSSNTLLIKAAILFEMNSLVDSFECLKQSSCLDINKNYYDQIQLLFGNIHLKRGEYALGLDILRKYQGSIVFSSKGLIC